MKRKLLTFLLLLIMVFAVGCNNKDTKNNPASTPTPTATPPATPTPTPINQAKENLEKLVSGYTSVLEKQPGNQIDLSKGIGYDLTLDISPGKQIMGLLGISGLDSVRLTGTMDVKDTISSNLELYLNASEIIKASVFMNGDNLLFNLPKYASNYASLSLEELLSAEDAALSDSLGTIKDNLTPSKSLELSTELTKMFQTHLTSLVDAFKKVDAITPNSSIGTGEYTMTGDRYTVIADPKDILNILKAFEADMEKYYGELDFGLSDLEGDTATALFLDYYTDETGNYAWAFHTDESPDEQIVFINTSLGFCLYRAEDGKQIPAMASVKYDEKTGVVTLYSGDEAPAEGELPEEIGSIDYEYEENSLRADILFDTIEASIECSVTNDVVSCDITLIVDGMSFVIKEKASKEHIEASFTLASYGIEYATVNMDLTLRDYVDTPAPTNAVDLETWSAGLNQFSLLGDLTRLMQEYPFLALLFNSSEE